ncbi:MAG: SDR family oxidoreductase [Spirochaetota bacterium]|nr:MAG: SDR family oxidoreductase [Spirochaetota bacterium]
MKLKGKVSIVTGASRGIGKAISEDFAKEGANVALVDIDPGPLQEVALRINKKGGTASAIQTDVSDTEAVERMVSEVIRRFGAVDILVNNAGIILRGGFTDLSLKDWERVLSVNLGGTFNCCKAVVPHMLKHGGGKIVNVSSIAGKIGDITASPAYGTSKGAINTFTKSLARQLAKFGINVNAVAPHAIETDMSAQWSEEKRRDVVSTIPLQRMGKPEEVAAVVVFLTTEGAGFITGEVININGGYLMD